MAKILVIDDSADSVALFEALLSTYIPETEILAALSGQAGLDMAIASRPDLVLVDAVMPVVDGFEVCRRLRSDPRTSNIPILMISGVMVDRVHRVSGMESGADGYICKPFEREEIIAQVNVLLRVKRYEDELRNREKALSKTLEERSERLRRSEQQLRSLFEHSPDAIFVEDMDGNVLDANVAACRLHGLSWQELVGHNVRDLVPPEHRDSVVAEFPRWGTGELQAYEGFSYTRSGQMIPVEVRANRIQYAGRDALLLHVRDITDRRKTEGELQKHREHLEEMVRERTARMEDANAALQREIAEGRRIHGALEESRENFHSIVEESADGILVVDESRIVRYANRQASEMLGTPHDAMMNHPCSLELSGDMQEMELASDVARCIVEVATTHTHWQGAPASLVVLRDITRRKQVEEELLKIQKLESLGVLAGGIAHDFNNILMGIIGNLSFAKADIDSKTHVVEAVSAAERSAVRAKILTQQLLTFSKGGAPVRMAASIRELMEDATRFMLAGSKTVCQFRMADNLWPANIDEGQISQVIENIVINADQAMPNGGTLHITADNFVAGESSTMELPGLQAGKYVKIAVKDEGGGIPEENLRKVFDPYFTTKQQGSGLGLATAYSIVRKHEGLLTVESTRDRGATFTIYLPATEAQPLVPPERPPEALHGKGRVLVMDDEEVVRNVTTRMLRTLGYEAELATDGGECLERFRTAKAEGRPFDAVILDLTVPGGMGGGEDTIKVLRSIDPDVRAVVSSGYSDGPIVSTFRRYGFRGVLTKPYDMSKLSQVLREVQEVD